MNTQPAAAAPAVSAAAAPDTDASSNALPSRIAHLFRRSLAQGRLHPLMPLLVHYRQSRGAGGPP